MKFNADDMTEDQRKKYPETYKLLKSIEFDTEMREKSRLYRFKCFFTDRWDLEDVLFYIMMLSYSFLFICMSLSILFGGME